MYSYTLFSETHNDVIVFLWMVETITESMKTQFQTTNNDCTVVASHLRLVRPCGKHSFSFSLVIWSHIKLCLNSIPALRADCFPLTFLHTHVLGDGRGASTSSDLTVCLSSRSKHGPLHSHSLRPHLHCKQISTLNKAFDVELLGLRFQTLWKETAF